MELSEQLRQVLSENVLEEMNDGAVNLRDPKSGMQYSIYGLPQAAAVVSIDGRIEHLSCVAERSGLRRVCDYLVVARRDGKESYDAVLIEMKTTLGVDEKHRDQLRRSKPILEYLRELCAVEYERKVIISIKYAIVASKISERLDKQPTRMGPIYGEDETYKGIRIRRLIGRGAAFRHFVK